LKIRRKRPRRDARGPESGAQPHGGPPHVKARNPDAV
jgi:hypothetical protein